MTREQLEALIDEIVDAERDVNNAASGRYRTAKKDYDETRERVISRLMEEVGVSK